MGCAFVMIGRLKAALLDPALTEHHLALGVVCREWASLEQDVGWALAMLLKTESIATPMILRPVDVRDQLASIKIGALFSSLSKRWTESVVDTANYIDNDLRPLRNRYVHDHWFVDVDGVTVYRLEISLTLRRPQSREALNLYAKAPTEVPIEHMWILANEMRLHARYLAALCQMAHKFGEQMTRQPRRPPRRLRETGPQKPPPQRGSAATPRARPRSSRA